MPRVSIRVLFMTFVTLATGLVFGISFGPALQQNIDTANKMGDELLASANANAANSVEAFITEMVQLAGNLVRMMDAETGTVNEQRVKRHFATTFTEYRSRGLSYLALATEAEGYFWGLEASRNGDMTWFVLNATLPERVQFTLDLNPPYIETPSGIIRKGFDPRARSWYTDTNTSVVTSTKAYSTTSGDAAITMGAHILHPVTRQVFGVAAVDITTDTINKILRGMKFGETGHALITEIATGSVLGISSDERLVLERNDVDANSLEILLLHIDNVTTPVLKRMISVVGDTMTSTDELLEGSATSGTTFNGVVDNNGMWVSIKEIRPIPGLALRLGIAIPRSDYLGDIEKSRNAIVIAAVCTLVVVMVMMFFITWRMTTPLLELGDYMNLTASLEIVAPSFATSLSSISEIYEMQRAYLIMNEQIGRAKSFMPLSLLLGDDDMEEENDEGTVATNSDSDRKSGRKPSTSRASGSRGSGIHSGHGSETHSVLSSVHASPAALATALGDSTISSRNTAMLCLNVEGFNQASLKGMTQAAITQSLTTLADFVTAAATENRGMVDNLVGDHFFVSFNASKPCAAFGTRACHMALKLEQTIAATRDGLSQTAKSSALPFERFTIGIAAGFALVGSVGNNAIKRFAVMGPLVNRATHLAKVAKHFNALKAAEPGASGPFVTTLASNVAVRDVMDVNYVWAGRASATGVKDPFDFARVVSAKTFDEGEWMYQLEESGEKQKDPATVVSRGIEDLNAIYGKLLINKNGLLSKPTDAPEFDVSAIATQRPRLFAIITVCDTSFSALTSTKQKHSLSLQREVKAAAVHMMTMLDEIEEHFLDRGGVAAQSALDDAFVNSFAQRV